MPDDQFIEIAAEHGQLRLHSGGLELDLSERWRVFYALLALRQEGWVSADELSDYFPWNQVKREHIGKLLWRFIQQQETKVFGEAFTCSPPRQGTKLFRVRKNVVSRLRFVPGAEAVFEALHQLRQSHNNCSVLLSEYALLIQCGHLQEALGKLKALREQPLSEDDLAHAEALITSCLDRLYGVEGTGQQVERLQHLLTCDRLSRINQGRLRVRLARHHMRSEEYSEAAAHFASLKRLLRPEDGFEFCQYQLNYGLFLRRLGRHEEAIEQTLIAHECSHVLQWWYGVQAAQSNLALMNLSLAEHKSGSARRIYLFKAQEWALKGLQTTRVTIQGADEADMTLILGIIARELGEYIEGRQWLEQTISTSVRIPNYDDAIEGCEELARLEERVGDSHAAQLARRKAEELRARKFMEMPGSG